MTNATFHHLHPLAILTYSTRTIGFWFGLGVWKFIAHSEKVNNFGSQLLWLALGVIGLSLLSGLYKWFSTTWYSDTYKIYIRKGWVNRQQISLPFTRIQALHRSENLILQKFGLTDITIELTGASKDHQQVKLPLLRAVEINELMTYFHQDRSSVQPDALAAAPKLPDFQVSLGAIALFTLTDWQIITILFFIIGFRDKLADTPWLAYFDQLIQYFNQSSLFSQVMFIFLGFALIIGLSFMLNFNRYFHFQVTREQNHLLITQGLWNRKTLSVDLHRIQAIQFQQSFLRRLGHLQSVKLILATSTDDDDQDHNTSTVFLFPIIFEQQLFTYWSQLIPDYPLPQKDDWQTTTRPHWFFFIRWRLCIGIISLVVVHFMVPLASFVALLFALLWWGAAWWQAYVQGYALSPDNRLYWLRQATFFSLRTTMIPFNKIQSSTYSTTYWLQRRQLGHFKVSLKAGQDDFTGQLRFLPLKVCQLLQQQLTPLSGRN